MKFIIGLMVVSLFFVSSMSIFAETLKCKSIKDVWISAHPKEVDYNMGASNKIKLKIWQEHGIIDFDVSQLKGKKISEAWIFIKPAGGAQVWIKRRQ